MKFLLLSIATVALLLMFVREREKRIAVEAERQSVVVKVARPLTDGERKWGSFRTLGPDNPLGRKGDHHTLDFVSGRADSFAH